MVTEKWGLSTYHNSVCTNQNAPKYDDRTKIEAVVGCGLCAVRSVNISLFFITPFSEERVTDWLNRSFTYKNADFLSQIIGTQIFPLVSINIDLLSITTHFNGFYTGGNGHLTCMI